MQGLRPFASSLPQGLKRALKKGGFNFSYILDNWTKIVGQKISNDCYPYRIKMGKEMKNGCIILNVLNGKQLDIEYLRQDIKDKINMYFGTEVIDKIKLRVINQKQSKRKQENPIDTKDKFDKKIMEIQNDKLEKSLKNLIEAYRLRDR